MFKYNITCHLKNFKPSKYLLRLLNKTLKVASFVLNLKPKINYFELEIVSDETIRKINQKYRNKDNVTDVISLQYNEAFQFINCQFNHLGEIYLNYFRTKEQAIKYGHTFAREFCFLVLHGVLHLIGYDHMQLEDEKVMFGLQDEILKQTKIKTLQRKK